jgi:hypothetical protein
MGENSNVKFICGFNHEAQEGFKIFIDDKDISENVEKHKYIYNVTHKCKSGKYKLTVIQNNFIQSKRWGLLSVIYGILAAITGSFEEYTDGIGPYYAFAEGELLITGDASIEVMLFGKRINKNSKTCGFEIKPKVNCSWSEVTNDFITSPRNKRRWIFAAILPMTLLVAFIGLLSGLLGVRAFSQREIIFGLFNMIILILALAAYVYHIIMTIRKANNDI